MNTAKKTDLTIATTILNQLGGKRFIAMTGSKDFVGSENSLQFKVIKNVKNVTHVKIEYSYGKDLYSVSFLKWNARKFEFQVIANFDEQYAEDLQDRFEENTGLLTSL